MNGSILEGRWTELKGHLKSKWAKLTDNDVDLVSGKVEKLSGILQQRYGFKKDEAEKDIDGWMESLKKRN